MTNLNTKKGFTLAETIVVIAIFTILTLGVSALFSYIFSSSKDRLVALDDLDHAHLVATNFTNEIRIASVGNTGAYPLNQASDTQIVFYSNYGQATGTIAQIRYYQSGNDLYKGVTLPSGNPLTYIPAQEKVWTVQDNITNTGQPIFYYYDGDYNGSSTPLLQPVNINQVKYVRISFNILKQSAGTSTSFNITTGSSIRNLKTNLGN